MPFAELRGVALDASVRGRAADSASGAVIAAVEVGGPNGEQGFPEPLGWQHRCSC